MHAPYTLCSFHLLSRECRDIVFFCFGVNVRCCVVAGTVGGGTPGHLIMGDGLFIKKLSSLTELCNQIEKKGFSKLKAITIPKKYSTMLGHIQWKVVIQTGLSLLLA